MKGKYDDLLFHCASLLETYDPETRGTDEHLAEYFENCKVHDECDKVFIEEVFFGCVRYGSIMKVVLDAFYARDGRTVLFTHKNSFSVLAYLALFRLEELGVGKFRKFVSCFDMLPTHKFLRFFFNEKNILTWLKDGWNKVFDPSFVQTKIISPILRRLPELEAIVNSLKDKLENNTPSKKTTIPLTEPKPFNLTELKPRGIEMPEKIPTVKKVKPLPSTLYRTPTEQEELALKRQENRKNAEKRLLEASQLQFSCATAEPSAKTKQRLQRIEDEENSKIDPNRNKARPIPDFTKDSVPVKMTAAQILRENALFQKQEDEIVKKLKSLEAGAFDSSSFDKWQDEMRQKDIEANLAFTEEQMLLTKLSHEEAILAKTNLVLQNQARVQRFKEETAEMMQQHMQEQLLRDMTFKNLKENTIAGHRNAKDAKKRIQEQKQKIAQELNEETKELLRIAFEEAEMEMRCKMDLIQEIRAMEAVPVSRFKMVDLASTSGVGLLSEMSIVELRERLSLMKDEEKEKEELKRDAILNEKQAKAEFLSETMERVLKHRNEQIKAAALKQEDKKKRASENKHYRNEVLTDLERRVEERKAQRIQEQERVGLLRDKSSARRTGSLISQKVCIANALLEDSVKKIK